MCSIGKLIILLVVTQALTVVGYKSCPYGGHMIAASAWRITIFNQTLPEVYHTGSSGQREGMECLWQIETENSGAHVRLTFASFHLKNSTRTSRGDCVYIYDGKDDSADRIQELCDRIPEKVYNSSGTFLTVVFRQREQKGQRWMTLNYTLQVLPEDTEDEFWTSTLGRVISIVIFISIFAVFSLLFRSWRSDRGGRSCGTLRDLCNSLSRCVYQCRWQCQRHAQDMCHYCHSLCQLKNGGGPSSAHRSRRQSSEAEAQSVNTDIATISESRGQLSVPSFAGSVSEYGGAEQRSGQRQDSESVSSTSSEIDLQAPPPDYFSVLSPPGVASSDSNQGERTPVAPPPDYSSTLAPFYLPNPPPPPPDDDDAPPSYELPDPPSYDSLFDNNTSCTNA